MFWENFCIIYTNENKIFCCAWLYLSHLMLMLIILPCSGRQPGPYRPLMGDVLVVNLVPTAH